MQYQGGKHYLKRDIGKLVMYHWRDGMNYYEPFVGGASILDAVRWLPCQKFASDASPDLIALWKAVQAGWEPPDTVTEEEYHYWKAQAEPSAMRGFVGHGCSFGGKFFGGYARNNKGFDYIRSAKNGILSKAKCLHGVELSVSDYREVPIPLNSLVYCDPPYQGTKAYNHTHFIHYKFWDWVREVSQHSTVLVSEFRAPKDFAVIMKLPRKMSRRDEKSYGVVDKVFKWNG